MTWEETAKAKREQVLSQIPKEWIIEAPSIQEQPNAIDYLDSVLPDKEKSITSQSLLSLKDKLATGELTSLEVTKAFAHRAALTHQLCNNLSEIFFDRAYKRAKELDDYLAKHKKPIGPLHGVPISLKDQINLEGLDTAIGFVGLLNKPKTKEDTSVIADILYNAGAVFYVKTTVPTAMLVGDTLSNIYGQTVNPYNRKLSPGGSSGGESSLIAARGAMIGLSTDIGGSIRIPAAFNGIFGIRPTTGRLPYAKVTNSTPHQTIVPSVIGPSAQYLGDLKYFVKVILDAKPWLYDPKTPPIPWRDYEVPKKLAFGIYRSNGFINPHPPVLRAIEEVKQKLEAKGHEVIEWNPPIEGEEIWRKMGKILGADGMKEFLDHSALSGESPIKQILDVDDLPTEVTVSENWEQGGLKYRDQQTYDKYWLATENLTSTGRPIDGWISPVWESASYPAGEGKPYHCTYTEVCNYLDYPSVVVPITYVDKEIDRPLEGYQPLNESDKETYELYDPEVFDKMPVAIQVITPRYEEERSIGLAEVVYKATH
jgi:amidase